MANKRVREYIEGGLKYGFKKEDLKKDLLNEGIKAEEIDTSMKHISKKKKSKTRLRVIILSIVLLVFIVVMIYTLANL